MVNVAGLLALLLGGIATVPALRAQPAARKVENRFLLVFDTSAEMKQRLPAVQKALGFLMATNMSGQLQPNDSLGVWTFDQDLQTGQFPLLRWKPDFAAMTVSNLCAFAASRRYSKKTRFEALVPTLNQLVQHSERLTTVIFCDGSGEMQETPYDSGVNEIFKQRGDERRRTRQPIVIVLRSQLGRYVDCVVSFPPQPVTFPEFPALPAPPAPRVEPPPAPRPPAQPLIIIGTPPTNRVPPPAPPPASPPAATVVPTPPPISPGPTAGNVSAPPAGPAPAEPEAAPAPFPPTNAIASAPAGSVPARGGIGTRGVVLLVAVGALVAFMLGRIWPAKKN